MKFKPQFLLLLLIGVSACNQPSQQTIPPVQEKYTSKEIGWTVEIPQGYQIMSKGRIEASEKKGREILGKANGTPVQTDSLVHLVNFQKNQFNLFMATIEPFTESKDGDYNTHSNQLKKLIYDAYTQQKIKIDTLSSKEVVSKIPFNVLSIKIYGPNGDVVVNQLLYSTLFKGYDFGITINFNNENDKNILINTFKSSVFATMPN